MPGRTAGGARLVTALALSLAGNARAADRDDLLLWRVHEGRLQTRAADAPVTVGSLVKPFLAKAWARSHDGEPVPRLDCDARSGCWLRAGHGSVGLARALAVSCNAYFRGMASATPGPALLATLRAEGFRLRPRLPPDALLGLEAGGGEAPRIEPSRLLLAYLRLVREPWASGESVRAEVVAGLRAAARDGTAEGLRREGTWAKTGTVAAGPGSTRTIGYALAVQDGGSAILARLASGTGRQAAAALGRALARVEWAGEEEEATPVPRVTVSLFNTLRPASLLAMNAGNAPRRTTSGFVGPGGSVRLRAGLVLSEGLWDVREPASGLVRRIEGAVRVEAGPSGGPAVRARVRLPEYVAGLVLAELGPADPRREALGAAALRFLAAGPRHDGADVCDTTHCAWFVGRGPLPRWPTPGLAVLRHLPGRDRGWPDAAAWERLTAAAARPGPAHWTSHCGGRPLPPRAVWGDGDRTVLACARHLEPARPWRRHWDDGALRQAFGDRVVRMAVDQVDGVWTLRVETESDRRELGYDGAHRALARVLGWAALPSPADRVLRTDGGFVAEGVGLGHRVGLCLGS